VPDEIEKGVEFISSAISHNCVIKNQRIYCWGIIESPPSQFYITNKKNKFENVEYFAAIDNDICMQSEENGSYIECHTEYD